MRHNRARNFCRRFACALFNDNAVTLYSELREGLRIALQGGDEYAFSLTISLRHLPPNLVYFLEDTPEDSAARSFTHRRACRLDHCSCILKLSIARVRLAATHRRSGRS